MPEQAAVFHLEGDRFVPTEIARGPWDPGAQHGGAPAALLARAVERHEPGPATHVARLTVELLRPVPLTPLEVRCELLRPGKNVQLVQASLLADGTEVARATGLRLRQKELTLPRHDPLFGRALPSPAELPPLAIEHLAGPNFGDAMEIVPVTGGPGTPGPASVWFRLRVPLVAEETPSPLSRTAAAADFGNGISALVDWNAGWRFINPDLTVYLHRYPAGEWVALDAVTYASDRGVGTAEAVLYDEAGRIGRSIQSLLFDRR